MSYSLWPGHVKPHHLKAEASLKGESVPKGHKKVFTSAKTGSVSGLVFLLELGLE